MSRKIYKKKIPKNNKILPGNPCGLSDDFSEVVVFIDNAYLMRLKRYFFNKGLKYSTKKFVENIADKDCFLVKKIFLYDANFTWDNTDKRLGIGTSSPSTKLDVQGDVNIWLG